MTLIMRLTNVPHEQIQGPVHFKCDDGPHPRPRSRPVAAPAVYAFNHEVTVDVLAGEDAGAD